MNYHKYYPIDVVNGLGTRCTLFVAGCVHKCHGCYNARTWKVDSGFAFTQQLEDQIIADLQDKRIKRRGLTLSGGDPLHPANLSAVLKLVRRVRLECLNKDIWLWTGYTMQQITPSQMEIVELIDVLIDGKFVQELADPALRWRGSSNQVVHQLTPKNIYTTNYINRPQQPIFKIQPVFSSRQ